MPTPESANSSAQTSSSEGAKARLFRNVKARQNLRLLVFAVTLVALAGGAWAAFYAYDRGFTKRWRRSIIEELAQHGIVATIGRLTIDPVEGLVARNVFLYDDPKQKRLLAKINRISLDIDLGRLLRNEQFLSKIDFKNADLSLPLEPERKNSETLRIRDFSAHLLMENDRFEITRASGLLSGVAFSIQGSLLGYQASTISSSEDSPITFERMNSLKNRRALGYAITQSIERFKFRGATPRIDIEVSGDLKDADTLRGTVAFSGAQISHRDYVIRSVKGALELQGGELALQHLILNDDAGELHLSGVHTLGKQQVDFHIDSSAGIHRLLRSLNERFHMKSLNFREAPEVTARGTYGWGSEASVESGDGKSDGSTAVTDHRLKWALQLPLKMIGSIRCDSFAYQGSAFGSSFDFNIDHDRLYLRNVSIEDTNSGSLDGDLLVTPEESHYDARLRMAPTQLSRFLPDGSLKEWLNVMHFPDDSSVQVEMSGHRTKGTDDEWTNGAEIDLRDFEIRGQKIDRFECDVIATAANVIFKDVRVERNGSSAFEPKATWSVTEKKLTLTSLTSGLDPESTVFIFSPSLAERFRNYSFESPPNLQIKGSIVPGSMRDCDLTAVLTSRGGSRYMVDDYDLSFTGAHGNLQLKESILTLNLAGKTASNTAIEGLTLKEASPVAFAGRFPLAENSTPAAYKVISEAPEGATFRLAGVDFPLSNFEGEFVMEGSRAQINGSSSLFDGRLAVSLSIPDTALPGYLSTVKAEDVDFGKLAAHLTPNFKTQGKLTLLSTFSGVNDAPASIDGGGTMRITDGNIFAIPVLGPLSPVVSKLYKNRPVGYSVAREATASFKIRGGRMTTEDFTSATGAFSLQGNGVVDFINDRVDLDASLRARSAVGVLFYPVSRLFRFSAKGTMTDPQWRWLDPDIPENAGGNEDSSQ